MLGGPLGVALWSLLGFFNGIGRPTVTLWIAVGVAVANACLNQLFMFNFGLGVAGSGLGDRCRAAASASARRSLVPGPAIAQALSLASDRAAARRGRCCASASWDFRWAC